MSFSPLRFVTFLAPNMRPVYEYIAHHVGERLSYPTELAVGTCYDQIVEADVAFLCGLPYVRFMERSDPIIELLAAPVLSGARYAGRPIYFSDVIVHRDSAYHSFSDLRGATWAFNEPNSHSGFGVVRYHLACLGETMHFFGRVVEAGFHERSLRMVACREVDASAIDSQVLAVARRDHPDLVDQLRTIATLGPSTIQPVVASRRLPAALKESLRSILAEMHHCHEARKALAHGFVDHFVNMNDEDYDDSRAMSKVAPTACRFALA